MPEIAVGNRGSQTDVPSDDGTSGDRMVDASTCAPQSPSPPFPPSPSDGVLSGSLPVAASGSDAMSDASSNSSGTTMEDLLSESSHSSAPSPCSSRSYNRADFPFDNEIEEFMSPSFQWPPSPSASFVSRQDSSGLTDVVQRQSRRQLVREVREKSNRLLILLNLLKHVSWSANDPYTKDYKDITKASALVTGKSNIIRRVPAIIPTSSIENVLLELGKAIEKVSWLVRVAVFSSAAGDEGYLGLLPIANDEPALYFMWEQVAKLLHGSRKDQAAAATELRSLDGYKDWVQSLINVLNAGKDVEVQERAAKVLGLLSREGPGAVDIMVKEGICYVFTKVLNEEAMKVQAMVAWAISELAANQPQCQDYFAENNTVQLLVGHLAFETFREQRMFSVGPVPKATSIHSVVLANTNTHIQGREQGVDPATKSRMKAMAARALSALAKGNSVICKSIIETRGLLTLVVLLEKGTEEVRSNSAIAVIEIARVAEADNQIMRLAFPTGSPTAKAVVNQLLQIVEKAEDNDLLVPSIVALGCLSKTFWATTETRLIWPLVSLLDEREADVMLETAIALTKFAETDNFLYMEHCKAIIDAGRVKHLIKELVVHEPVLSFMWEQVAKLLHRFPKDQAAAATELWSLDGYKAWVQSLINVLNFGKDVEVQERAAKVLGLLSREGPGAVDVMVEEGICYVFTRVLNEGAMKVQAMVAWAVSELAANHPQCQDYFAENNTVQLLVGHLAVETFQGHRISPQLPVPDRISPHLAVETFQGHRISPHLDVETFQGHRISLVLANANTNTHIRGREQEDPATKSRMKAMAAKALSALAKGNPGICDSIIEIQALLAFVVLLQKGTEEVRSNSAIAVMEIARVAESDNQIMQFAFRITSPTAEAVVNQLLKIVSNWKAEHNDLLVPSIVALGCVSKTFLFRATQTRLIEHLTGLLYERGTDVILETAITITKFVIVYKAIFEEGGWKDLDVLVTHRLAQEEALTVLERASKQSGLVQHPTIERLLRQLTVGKPERIAPAEVLTVLEGLRHACCAKSKLELYHSSGGRGFH